MTEPIPEFNSGFEVYQWVVDTIVDKYESSPYYRNRLLPPIVFQVVESMASLQEHYDEKHARELGK